MERCGAEEGYTANFKSSSRPPVLSSQNLSLLQSAWKMFHNLAILIESGISQERCCWPCPCWLPLLSCKQWYSLNSPRTVINCFKTLHWDEREQRTLRCSEYSDRCLYVDDNVYLVWRLSTVLYPLTYLCTHMVPIRSIHWVMSIQSPAGQSVVTHEICSNSLFHYTFYKLCYSDAIVKNCLHVL